MVFASITAFALFACALLSAGVLSERVSTAQRRAFLEAGTHDPAVQPMEHPGTARVGLATRGAIRPATALPVAAKRGEERWIATTRVRPDAVRTALVLARQRVRVRTDAQRVPVDVATQLRLAAHAPWPELAHALVHAADVTHALRALDALGVDAIELREGGELQVSFQKAGLSVRGAKDVLFACIALAEALENNAAMSPTPTAQLRVAALPPQSAAGAASGMPVAVARG